MRYGLEVVESSSLQDLARTKSVEDLGCQKTSKMHKISTISKFLDEKIFHYLEKEVECSRITIFPWRFQLKRYVNLPGKTEEMKCH